MSQIDTNEDKQENKHRERENDSDVRRKIIKEHTEMYLMYRL